MISIKFFCSLHVHFIAEARVTMNATFHFEMKVNIRL